MRVDVEEARERAEKWLRHQDGTVITRDNAFSEDHMALDVLALLDELTRLRTGECAGVIPDTFVACGEGGNYCSEVCRLRAQNIRLRAALLTVVEETVHEPNIGGFHELYPTGYRAACEALAEGT